MGGVAPGGPGPGRGGGSRPPPRPRGGGGRGGGGGGGRGDGPRRRPGPGGGGPRRARYAVNGDARRSVGWESFPRPSAPAPSRWGPESDPPLPHVPPPSPR